MASSNITVHTYASPGMGSVNTHWIESPTGLVVIEGNRLSAEAQVDGLSLRLSDKP